MSTNYQSKTATQASGLTPPTPVSSKANGRIKSAKITGSQGNASVSGATRVAHVGLKTAPESLPKETAFTDSVSTGSAPLASLTASTPSATLDPESVSLSLQSPVPLPTFLVAALAIQDLYVSTGGWTGILGNPMNASAADALPDGVGYFRAFQYGSIY